MEISAKPPTAKGPAETFTGDVWVDPITRGLPPSPLNVAAVRFSPGARSAWHSHEGGQTLYVTEGRGLVQVRGEDAVEIHAGDVVYAPDGEEHWHGATPDDFMTHLSITEGAPHWGDHVTDQEYAHANAPWPSSLRLSAPSAWLRTSTCSGSPSPTTTWPGLPALTRAHRCSSPTGTRKWSASSATSELTDQPAVC